MQPLHVQSSPGAAKEVSKVLKEDLLPFKESPKQYFRDF
jgi:hypothetical protein